ncbi:MAG: SurA N-terminal domain-containing protein [Sedimenticolaceae bacterium]
MLQAIREKAQGWIAWAIVILISVPFALWGIQEYLGVGAEPEVAVVEGEVITERMLDQRTRQVRERMRATLGDAYRADLFEENQLKQQTLDAMVEEMVLVNHARDWNMRTSDAQARDFIASISAFQREGRFDQQVYEASVRNLGQSRSGFEQSVRQDMALDQLRSGIRETTFVTETDLRTRIGLADEKRTFDYARIPAAAYRDGVAVTTDAVRDFYDSNSDRYRTPERMKLSYLLLDATSLGGLVEVDEEALRQYFDDHRAEFVAREERAMRHILIAVPPGAGEDEINSARQKAEALLEQLRADGDFAELARVNSDDPGSSADGGDLGWVELGMMVPAFEEAAFALPGGEISDLVRTDFGFHIIQVTDVRGGSDAGFAELRDQVESAYRKFEAENLYFDYAERLAESAYDHADSLTPAAEALDLQIQSTDWVTRDAGLPEGLDSPRVLNAAFSDDVLQAGNNSELIEIGPQRAVVIRVAEYEPAGVLPFDDNRAAIDQDFVAFEASKAAAQTGRQMLALLAKGEKTLQQVASDHAWQIESPGPVGRVGGGVPAEVLAEAFAMQPARDGGAVHGGVGSGQGDFYLISLTATELGSLDALADAERPLVSEQAAGQVAGAQMRYFTQSLRNRSDVEKKSTGE